MAKIYTEKKTEVSKKQPKPETVSFILNYSKSLTVVKAGNITCEVIKN